ncbi:MAG: hypothetical protein Q9222_007673, partial [Ikaeria aurantiellina]
MWLKAEQQVADQETLRIVNNVADRVDEVWWYPIMRRNRRKRAEYEAGKVKKLFRKFSLIDDATKIHLAETINNDKMHLLYFESLVSATGTDVRPSVKSLRERRRIKEEQALIEAGIECQWNIIARLNMTQAEVVSPQSSPVRIDRETTMLDAGADSIAVEPGDRTCSQITVQSPRVNVTALDSSEDLRSKTRDFCVSHDSGHLKVSPLHDAQQTGTTDGTQNPKSTPIDGSRALGPTDPTDTGTTSGMEAAKTLEDPAPDTARDLGLLSATNVEEKLGPMVIKSDRNETLSSKIKQSEMTDGSPSPNIKRVDGSQAPEPIDIVDVDTTNVMNGARTSEDPTLVETRSPSLVSVTTVEKKLDPMNEEPDTNQNSSDLASSSSGELQQPNTTSSNQSPNDTCLSEPPAPPPTDTTDIDITRGRTAAHIFEDPASVATEDLDLVSATSAGSVASPTGQLLPAIGTPLSGADPLPVGDVKFPQKPEAKTPVYGHETRKLSRNLQALTPLKIQTNVPVVSSRSSTLKAQDLSSNSPNDSIRYSSQPCDKSLLNCTQPDHRVVRSEQSTTPASSFAHGWHAIKWAYRTFTLADDELLRHGLWLYDPPPSSHSVDLDLEDTTQKQPLQQTVVVAGTSNSPTPECTLDSQVLTIHPHYPPHSDDHRSIHNFAGLVPDFLFSSKLAEYQAIELAGRQVWRHDRDLLPCRGPRCLRVLSDMVPSTLICLTCGPKSQIRFCSPECQYRSIPAHRTECGNPALLIPIIIDHATTPPRFSQLPPAIRERNGFSTLENYRQRTMAQSSGGRYTLFDPYTQEPLTLFWDARRTTSSLGNEFPYPGYAAEMESRVERCLNIALYDHSATVVVEHLFRLLHLCLQIKRSWTPALAQILVLQFQYEFNFNVVASSSRT